MPSMLALALALVAFQAATGSRGRLTLRGIQADSRHVRGADASAAHHNASQPRTPGFFTLDAEDMDAVPNTAPIEAPASNDADGHSCHPKCWWECGKPKCNTECSPTCKAPSCVTTCEKMSMKGCQRLCTQPQCAVVCPKQCNNGKCPECMTLCEKQPKCSLACGRTCSSKCGDPVCAWTCKVGTDCAAPSCKMHCDKPSCTGFKGKDHTLHDVYHGFGDPTEEQSAVYGIHEKAGDFFAAVPAEDLKGLAPGPMVGPLAAGPPLPMEGPKGGLESPLKGPEEAKAPCQVFLNQMPWKAGAGGPKKPCKEVEADIGKQTHFVGPGFQ